MEEKGEKAEVRVQRAYLEQGKAPTQLAFRLCVEVLSCSVVSDSLLAQELQLSRLLCPWDFPGKNTGVGCQQEYWSGLSLPPPGDFPNLGIEPVLLASLALAGGFFTSVPHGKP